MDPFNDKILHAAAQIEIRPRRRAASLLSGGFRSAFRGSGMHFKEFRSYELGDDIRHMSWPVTARTQKATIKVYEEERDLNIVVIADVSGSALVGAGTKKKRDFFADVTALIGLAATKAGDPFSLFLFTDTVKAYFPARRTKSHVRSCLSQMRSEPYIGSRTDLRPVLMSARRALKSRSLIYVISDFDAPPFETELRALAARHEVTLIRGTAPVEQGENLDGVYPAFDPEEGGSVLVDGGSRSVRKTLRDNSLESEQKLRWMSQLAGVEYLSLSVEDGYLNQLVTFFRSLGALR
jgi:uncharacterized protein (DUF58 family)